MPAWEPARPYIKQVAQHASQGINRLKNLFRLIQDANDASTLEESRQLCLKWDGLIIDLQQGKSCPDAWKKVQSWLPYIWDAKVAVQQKYPRTGVLEEKIPECRRDFDDLVTFISDKSYKASDRTKILTLDSMLTALEGRLDLESSPVRDAYHSIPRLYVTIDPQTNRPLYHSMRSASSLKNLSLRGGGGKGQGYVKMIQVLRKNKWFDALEYVAGSSAGGIAAIALAFGIEDLEQFCTEVQASIMRKQSRAAFRAMPFLKRRFRGLSVLGSAAGVIDAIDRITTRRIQDFLNRADIRDFVHENVFGAQLHRLEQLRTRAAIARDENDFVTFADLALLREIASAAGLGNYFLRLALSFWNTTRQQGGFFNEETYPDLPIAYAVRATMALPGVFQSIVLELDDQECIIQDGAIGSNSPTEVFFRKPGILASEAEKLAYQKAQSWTLTTIFDTQGEGHRLDSSRYTYDTSTIVRIFLNLTGTVKDEERFEGLNDNENEKLNLTGNILVVPSGDLDTSNLNPSPAQKIAADKMSELATEAWCCHHAREGVDLTSFSLELLLQDLSVEERDQVVDSDWCHVLRVFLSSHQGVLSRVTEDLQAGRVIYGVLQNELNSLPQSYILSGFQRAFLGRIRCFELWNLLSTRARFIFCTELKRSIGLP